MAPRTEWACQLMAFVRSLIVAPSLRSRRAINRAALVPGRAGEDLVPESIFFVVCLFGARRFAFRRAPDWVEAL
jgi:hypothetical protein